jgi:hypothetical protein
MCLITNYVGRDNAMTLVVKYDNNLLLPFINEGLQAPMPTIVKEPQTLFHAMDTSAKTLKDLDGKKDLHLLLISC